MKYFSRFALTSFLSVAIATSAFAAQDPVAKPLSAWLVGPSQASQFDKEPDGPGCLMVAEFDNGMIVGVHARQQGIVGMTVDTGNKTMTPGTTEQVGLNVGGDSYAMNAIASDSSTLSLDLDETGPDGGKHIAERLTELGNFRILLNKKPVYFATTGFTDGLARLQACMGGVMAVPVVVEGPGATAGKVEHNPDIESKKVTSSGHETPLALAMPNLVPSGYRFVLSNVDPMTPISWQAGDDWVQVMRDALEPHGLKMVVDGRNITIARRTADDEPVIEGTQNKDADVAQGIVKAPEGVPAVPENNTVPVGVWAGASGEKLADVLESWGLMSGVKVKVDLNGDYKLPKDVRYEGRFDDAVQQLLGQYAGGNRPSGTFLGLADAKNAATTAAPRAPVASARVPAPIDSGWRPSPIDRIKKSAAPVKQMAPIPDPANAPKIKTTSKTKTSGTWSALQGTSLRDVLEHWGADANVQVVWLTDQNFPLPETIKQKGKFEEAVMAALGQYQGQGVRPIAQLNKDPDTGKKVLIIKRLRG